MRSSFPRVILFTLLAMLLHAIPTSTTPSWIAADPLPNMVTVQIKSDGPVSPTVTITVGMAIQWYNLDGVSHTITSDTGAFTVTLGTDNQTMKVLTTFDTVGTFPYHLDADRLFNVTGTIIVIDSNSTPTDSPTPADTSTPTATSTSLPSATPTMTAAGPTATTAIPPSDTPTATATSQPLTTVPVFITADQGFVPSPITITVGTAIQWTNERSSSVTVAVDQEAILVGPIGTGASATLTFTQTGLYTCTLVGLPGISGLVLVAPAPLTPSPTDSSTSTGTASPTSSPTASATVIPAATDTAMATSSPTAIPRPSNSPTETASALVTNTPPSATVTATAAPAASGTSTVGAPSVTDTAIPSPTPTPSPTDNATGTPTVPLTTTPSPTSSATQTASATAATPVPSATETAEATDSRTTSPTPPEVFSISLIGNATVRCIPGIPIGSEVRWSNDNSPGGISYDVMLIRSDGVMVFQVHLEPGQAHTHDFTDAGQFTYTISSNGSLLTTAVIPVGVEIPCPAPSATPTELATLVGNLTPTSIPVSPTATASDLPTATTVSLSTPTATATAAPTSRPTSTPAATSTATPIPTHTSAPASTPIPTPASEPSSTPTATATIQPPSSIPLQTPASSGAPPSPTAAKHTQAKPTVQTQTTTKRKQTVQPCWSALPREQVAMRVRGYLQHGPVRVAISLDLQVSAQRFSVTLHWRDPRSRLDLTSLYFSRPQIICRGLRLQGTASLGKHRRVPFVLQMAGLLRGKTTPAPVLDLALSALHYRLHGVLRGQKPLAVHYGVPIPPPVHKKGHP